MKTWTSFLNPSGKSGRIERSMIRALRISASEGRPSLLMKPPGILPAAYALSRYSTRSGKKLSGLSLSLTVTAARTIVSPNCTSADPAACFAMRPVSITRRLPANVLSMRCMFVFFVFVNKTARAYAARSDQRARLVPQSKIGDDLSITFDVRLPQIVEEAASLADHLEQP